MWNILQCAVQGQSHIKTDVPCQDKTFFYNEGDVSITALADGAGSAKLSHYGAEHITQYICNDLSVNFELYFNNNDGVAVKRELDSKIKNQISQLAKELKCESKDLSSTLLVAAVKADQYILIHIGDGVIGYTKKNEIKIASKPENGEFVNTTVFTTSMDSLVSMKLMKGKLGDVDGFILMSDGSEASLYNKRENTLASVLLRIAHMTEYIPLHKVQVQLTESFESVIRSATTDDCSISIMVNNYNRFSGYRQIMPYEKRQLFKIGNGNNRSDKQYKRMDQIVLFLEEPHSLFEISRHIHLKPKYTRKYLYKLINLNLIERKRNTYQTIIIF